MSRTRQILARVIMQQYYRLNAGFFLVLLLLLFGVIDPAASIRLHTGLMVLMGTDARLLAGALAVLGLYFVKCLRFTLQQAMLPENGMLYELQALRPARLRGSLCLVFAGVYAPALLYSACLCTISIMHRAWITCGITLVSQALLVGIATASLERRLLYRLQVSGTERLLRKLDMLRPAYLGFGRYFAAYLLAQKKIMLLLLKTGSLLLLQLMVYINKDEPERAGTFYVLLFLIIAHGLIPWQLRRFSESLPWLRNLPLSLLRRYMAFAGTYALLFLPELAFLLLHVRSSLSYADMLSFYALSVATLCGLHAILYLPGINMDRYLLVMLLLYPLSIILLASISPWMLAAGWFGIAALVFRLRYHSFEPAEVLDE